MLKKGPKQPMFGSKQPMFRSKQPMFGLKQPMLGSKQPMYQNKVNLIPVMARVSAGHPMSAKRSDSENELN